MRSSNSRARRVRAAFFSVAAAAASVAACGASTELVVAASDGPAGARDASADTGVDAGSTLPRDEASAPIDPFPTGAVWKGTYTCPQGLTALTLTIVDALDDQIRDARFDFDWSGGASGAFHMSGSFDPTTSTAKLVAGAWIVRPSPTWYTVGMHGTVDVTGTRFDGAIDGPGCSTFLLQRVH